MVRRYVTSWRRPFHARCPSPPTAHTGQVSGVAALERIPHPPSVFASRSLRSHLEAWRHWRLPSDSAALARSDSGPLLPARENRRVGSRIRYLRVPCVATISPCPRPAYSGPEFLVEAPAFG